MSGTIITREELIRGAWIEIDQAALAANLARVRALVGSERQIMAVVKADAYGHGAFLVADIMRKAGANQFAVATVEEGIQLRQQGAEEPILVLGPVGPEGRELAVRYQLAQAVFCLEQAREISQVAAALQVTAPVHCKLNTGMNRLGFALTEESVAQIGQIFALPQLRIDGVFSHFAEADGPGDFTQQQLTGFLQFIQRCGEKGLVFPLRHIANSAAILAYPAAYLDMVRPGIILYGCAPSSYLAADGFQPTLAVKARVGQLHTLAAGDGAGYGRMRRVDRSSIIAELPLGYADGIPRLISERGWVLLHGQKAPLAGRVCMDQLLADVTDIPGVQVGDEAVILGSQGKETISGDLLASWAETISYEVLTHLALRLPRMYV